MVFWGRKERLYEGERLIRSMVSRWGLAGNDIRARAWDKDGGGGGVGVLLLSGSPYLVQSKGLVIRVLKPSNVIGEV
jgi:hypothetical protein